ncbi:McrB family protein [Vibrio owensii]|uniref:McrB family protein n=1 Tax=Vibrio owensii TaxID=696485 RepID=UPI001F0E8D48|nr:AAA family ATPase [Vibrio owensii]
MKQYDKSKAFAWTSFYEEMATALLTFKANRPALLKNVLDIAKETGFVTYFNDQYADGTSGPVQDICPFTIMGMFNRGITVNNRILLAQKFAELLDIEAPVPTQFDAIPLLNNMNSWFFYYEKERQPDDIDRLWAVFEAALNFADDESETTRSAFIGAFDRAASVKNTKWNLTMALYWARPWSYPTLESGSRELLAKKYNYRFMRGGSLCSAEEYLDCIAHFKKLFATDPEVDSFPALSYAGWRGFNDSESRENELVDNTNVDGVSEPSKPEYASEEKPLAGKMGKAKNIIFYGPPGTGKTYHLQQLQTGYTSQPEVMDENLWLQEKIAPLNWMQVLVLSLLSLGKRAKVPEIVASKYFQIKARLNGRDSNLSQTAWNHLQKYTVSDSETVNYKVRAEPAVFDKSKDSVWQLLEDKLEQVDDLVRLYRELEQGVPSGSVVKRFVTTTFHQSYGYEEFIEGLRATTDDDGNVHYSVEAGEFLKLCRRAEQDPTHQYAIFIDEINRGNISKIFGELISLVEIDKRAQAENPLSINLAYSGQAFSVPSNVDIIGTMNTADRSLALMDTALRRRFEFMEMMPNAALFSAEYAIDFGHQKSIDLGRLLTTINERIEVLYDREHMLGHAFFYPAYLASKAGEHETALEQLKCAFQSKVLPLLQEYFHDDWSKIRLVLGDNQKRNDRKQAVEELQFVHQRNIDYKRLFGDDYELDTYDAEERRYELARDEHPVWINGLAYLTIYEPSLAKSGAADGSGESIIALNGERQAENESA